MNFKTILVKIEGQIALVTLNRPEAMNAWNSLMAVELSKAMAALDTDDAVRAVVVTGAGRAFCAGADLAGGGESFTPGTSEQEARIALGFPSVMPYQVRKPVLAAINGHAIGVGITYPMSCDIRIVAEDAKIQFAFVRRGLIPELSSHVIVARVAGFSKAADLMLTGRMITGRELAEMGLASQAVPAPEVLPAAMTRAREFLKAAPVSVAVSKRLLWEGLTSSVTGIDKREFPLFRWICRQPDTVEGIKSFLEKRGPQWTMSPTRDFPEM
jgi:enoyl-CoA hydratase/carnithine racemase